MKKTLQRGFTLIELLVVIAIIGILAAVVLASLNDARDGGQDAAIKQSIGNARSQAELIYNQQNYSYNNVCDLDADNPINTLMQAAADNRSETTTITPDNSGTPWTIGSDTNVACHSDSSGYVLAAPLNIQWDDGGTMEVAHWCVDSTGFAGTSTFLGTTDASCP